MCQPADILEMVDRFRGAIRVSLTKLSLKNGFRPIWPTPEKNYLRILMHLLAFCRQFAVSISFIFLCCVFFDVGINICDFFRVSSLRFLSKRVRTFRCTQERHLGSQHPGNALIMRSQLNLEKL
jgi:hypothetical protein